MARALRLGPRVHGPALLAVLVATLVCLGSACGASTARQTVLAHPHATPTVVTDATYGEARRGFALLGRDSPDRAEYRERLVDYLLAQADGVLDRGDYDEVVDFVASITELYTPQEISDGLLPPALGRAAHYLIEHGEPRGDEARVLSALLILKTTAADTKPYDDYYRRLQRWGFDARASLSSPLEPFETGVVDVWEEHARLTPTPRVLQTVARLYIEHRDALLRLFQSSEQRMPFGASVFQGMQQTALNVAAVFLRQGDVASALSHVDAMGTMGGAEERLIQVLEAARDDDSDGDGALLDLANIYVRVGRFDVTRSLCLHGLQRRREDPRFYQCLAATSARQGDFAGAMAWYSDAIALAPDNRGLYDEILQVLSSLMEQGLFSSDTQQTRMIATRAADVLRQRMERWPDVPPPVRPEELYLAIGIAEMNAGNAVEAEDRLRQSLKAKETSSALLQLGLLLERMNRGREAADLYRRALKLTSDKKDDRQKRAEILERLGDALRMQGEGQEASRMYERGLALWDENLSQLKGQRMGVAQLRRGVLLGRLDRRSDSFSAFEKAMELAPEMQETYATILAYLVVSEPDSSFAHRVFRNALNQLSLEPEWKVYFALWLRAIAGRTGASTEAEVQEVLEDMSGGGDWFAKLAAFASGKLDYQGLLDVATDVGERTEAHFYEGARRLANGDRKGAQEMFQLVLQTNMVNFYEFAMAQELAGVAPPSPPPSETSSSLRAEPKQ